MRKLTNKAIVSLVAVLLLVACTDEEAVAPEPAQEVTPTSGAPTPVVAPAPTATPEPVYEYLSHEIPPCTPAEGATVGPCEQGVGRIETGGSASRDIGSDRPFTVREILDGLDEAPSSFTAHIVVRATHLPNTVRCEPTSVDRAATWTGFDDYKHDGLSAIQCFSDVRANAYIVGSGPSTMTVMVALINYWGQVMPAASIAARVRDAEMVLRAGGNRPLISAPEGGIGGREAVLFLSPALDHSYEVWQSWDQWYVQRNDDGSIVALHPDREPWLRREARTGTPYRSQVEIPLETLIAEVQAAHTARLTEYGGRIGPATTYYTAEELPMLVTDANMLHSYHVAIGNTTHPDGPPVAPPAVKEQR